MDYSGSSLPKSTKYLVSRCLDPLKAEPQEVFVGPNTYSQGIWKTRAGSQPPNEGNEYTWYISGI